MPVALSTIAQIALPAEDIDAAEAFYERTLGLKKLFRPQPSMVFFDCAGVRLMIAVPEGEAMGKGGAVIYFNVPDIADAHRALTAKGVAFVQPPHRVAPTPDHDLWMAFFRDPAGNLLALSCRAPKGYALPA